MNTHKLLGMGYMDALCTLVRKLEKEILIHKQEEHLQAKHYAPCPGWFMYWPK